MKVLIACEYSGTVRDAFIARGHDAISCDLLPTDNHGPHYQGDVFDIINNGFDLMIAHPPCTFLSYAGNGWLNEEKWGEKAKKRKIDREEGLEFFMRLWRAPIKKIALENPRGYQMKFIKPSQIIHPYFFGDEHKKTTCLWLNNLPKLIHIKENDFFDKKTYTKEPAPIYIDSSGKKRYFTEAMRVLPGEQRWKNRSKTFPRYCQRYGKTMGVI